MRTASRTIAWFIARAAAAVVYAATLLPSTADAVVFRVGSPGDPACSTTSLATALSSLPATGQHEIRVSRTINPPVAGSIVNRSVTIIGGYANCSGDNPVPGASTTIGPLANATVRMLAIQATAFQEVTLRNLVFQGPAIQGAISATGPVDLMLENVQVFEAGTDTSVAFIDGGGISVANEAFLFLRDGTEIAGNEGFAGGGIHCATDGRVIIESGTALVSGNIAQVGGGMYLDGCRFTWQMEVPDTVGGIKGNSASAVGGGIAAFNGAILEGGDDVPRAIAANFAAQAAGGVFLVDSEMNFASLDIRSNRAGNAQSPGQTGFCAGLTMEDSTALLDRFRIEGNVAWRNGGGVCLLQRSTLRTGEPVDCPGGDCRVISNNRAAFGGQGEGGALRVHRSSNVELSNVRIEGNIAVSHSVLYADDDDGLADPTRVSLVNAVVAGNTGGGVFSLSDARLSLAWTTVANNASGNTTVFDFGGNTLSFAGTIFNAAPGITVLSAPFGTTLTTRCVGAHETQSLIAQGGAPALMADPGFIAPASGDYRLNEFGSAVDFCPGTAADPGFDIRGQPRPVDLPIPNIAGPYDMGAFETTLQADAMFGNGFE